MKRVTLSWGVATWGRACISSTGTMLKERLANVVESETPSDRAFFGGEHQKPTIVFYSFLQE